MHKNLPRPTERIERRISAAARFVKVTQRIFCGRTPISSYTGVAENYRNRVCHTIGR